jgi:hypothetical protein
MKAVITMQEASANNFATWCQKTVNVIFPRWSVPTHLADTTYILISRFFIESKVTIETQSNVVAVQSIDELAEMQ